MLNTEYEESDNALGETGSQWGSESTSGSLASRAEYEEHSNKRATVIGILAVAGVAALGYLVYKKLARGDRHQILKTMKKELRKAARQIAKRKPEVSWAPESVSGAAVKDVA